MCGRVPEYNHSLELRRTVPKLFPDREQIVRLLGSERNSRADTRVYEQVRPVLDVVRQSGGKLQP